MRVDRLLVALTGLLLATATCHPAPRDPGRITVARIEGSPVTLQDFDAYLEVNLVPGDEEPSNLVKSRLFDAFVEERVLGVAAKRAGADVATLEAQAYRRALEQDPIEEDEVRAYVREQGERLSGSRRVTFRSLPMGSVEEAAEVRRRILQKETTFDELGQGFPLTVIWQDLAEELRAALEGLRPGQVSGPVVTQGEVYLFRIESREGGGSPTDQILAQRARIELQEQRRREAHRAWLDEVRELSRVELEIDRLPFRYVPNREP